MFLEKNPETKMAEIECYECLWKKGETGQNYNENCGWESEFDSAKAPVVSGCGTCGIHRVMNDC